MFSEQIAVSLTVINWNCNRLITITFPLSLSVFSNKRAASRVYFLLYCSRCPFLPVCRRVCYRFQSQKVSDATFSVCNEHAPLENGVPTVSQHRFLAEIILSVCLRACLSLAWRVMIVVSGSGSSGRSDTLVEDTSVYGATSHVCSCSDLHGGGCARLRRSCSCGTAGRRICRSRGVSATPPFLPPRNHPLPPLVLLLLTPLCAYNSPRPIPPGSLAFPLQPFPPPLYPPPDIQNAPDLASELFDEFGVDSLRLRKYCTCFASNSQIKYQLKVAQIYIFF